MKKTVGGEKKKSGLRPSKVKSSKKDWEKLRTINEAIKKVLKEVHNWKTTF